MNINQVKEKYDTNKVIKWSFYQHSAPVYRIKKDSKTIIVDYRRSDNPEWMKVDYFSQVTLNRFHAIQNDKYIVADAKKGEVLATFKITPKWPRIDTWRECFSLKWNATNAEKFFMYRVIKWIDEKARGFKLKDLESVEDVAKLVVKEIFKRDNWHQYLPELDRIFIDIYSEY